MFRDTRIPLYDDGIGKVSLIDWMGDDLRACNAARVSFLNDLDGLDDGEITEKDHAYGRLCCARNIRVLLSIP